MEKGSASLCWAIPAGSVGDICIKGVPSSALSFPSHNLTTLQLFFVLVLTRPSWVHDLTEGEYEVETESYIDDGDAAPGPKAIEDRNTNGGEGSGLGARVEPSLLLDAPNEWTSESGRQASA